MMKVGRNSKGMSMIEVIIAVGMLGILVTFFSKLFTDSMQMQKHAEQRFGIVYLKNEIYQHLSSSLACSTTFANLQFAYSNTKSPSTFSVKQMKLASGAVAYRTFDDPAMPGVTYEQNNLRIKNFTISDYIPNETPTSPTDVNFYTGTAIVKIDFEKNVPSTGPSDFIREIKLNVTLKKVGELLGGIPIPAADDKKIRTCYVLGGSGESYWTATPAADGIYYAGGKVGIGMASPNATFAVDGTITGKAGVLNTTSTIDFSTGNMQYTNGSCAAYQLNNMKDGATYSLAVKWTAWTGASPPTTCSFTAYSGNGVGALTFHLPPDHGAITSGHTLYTFMVVGADIYSAWIAGY